MQIQLLKFNKQVMWKQRNYKDNVWRWQLLGIVIMKLSDYDNESELVKRDYEG